MSKPSSLPRWASVAQTPTNIVEPASGNKDAGFEENTQPPAQWFNWLFNLLYQWAAYLDGIEAESLDWSVPQSFHTDDDAQTTITVTCNGDDSVGIDVTGGTNAGEAIIATGGIGTTSGGIGALVTGGEATSNAVTAGTGVQSTGGLSSGTGGTGGIGVKGIGGAGATGGIGVFGKGGAGSAGVWAEGPGGGGGGIGLYATAITTGVAGYFEQTASANALYATRGTSPSGDSHTVAFIQKNRADNENYAALYLEQNRIGSSGWNARSPAINIGRGTILFSDSSQPTAAQDPGYNNLQCSTNLCKAWGTLDFDGNGNVTVTDGYNLTAAINGVLSDQCDVTFVRAMANSDYSIQILVRDRGYQPYVAAQVSGSFSFKIEQIATTTLQDFDTDGPFRAFIQIFGRQ